MIEICLSQVNPGEFMDRRIVRIFVRNFEVSSLLHLKGPSTSLLGHCALQFIVIKGVNFDTLFYFYFFFR